MKKIFFFNICLAFLLSACSSSTKPETVFNKYGISFTCPAGWEITEDEDDGDEQYITVEKNGFSSSGIVTIIVMDGEEIESELMLESMQESFESQPLFASMKISDYRQGEYGKYTAIYFDYSMNVAKLPHEGSTYALRSDEKLICISEQGALEDKKKNDPGFEKIKQSFSIE